jgi:hypothetical protein
MTKSNTSSCGITYNHHSADSRGAIYSRKNLIVLQATASLREEQLGYSFNFC